MLCKVPSDGDAPVRKKEKTIDGWTHVGADGETHADPNINKDSDRKGMGRHSDAETRHAPRQFAFTEAGVAKLTR